MKTQSAATAIALIAALGLGGQALAADPRPAPPAPATGGTVLPDRTTAAIEAVGKDVQNQVGQDIGDVHDVVAEKATGEVYAVISTGGFLGIGEKSVVVPLSSLNVGDENVILMSESTADDLQASAPYEPARYRSLAMTGPRIPGTGTLDRGGDDNQSAPANTGTTPGSMPGSAGGGPAETGGAGGGSGASP